VRYSRIMIAKSARTCSVCVVVPVYRQRLESYERIALERCLEVLKSYPIVVVKPQSLDLGELSARYPQLRFEEFADHFFAGIAGYNKLLLSDAFYARFAGYDYMLIHQLDAFVFGDELAHWCRRGYDYIGAPWLPHDRVFDRGYRIWLSLRRRLYRWIDKKHPNKVAAHHAQYLCCAGNGGFSLRRIRKMRALLAAIPARADYYRNSAHYSYNEDMFFSVEANRFRRRIKIPSLRTAAKFSWESQPTFASILTHGRLPFGCHGWNKLHRDEWRPIFASFGYDIDGILGPQKKATSSSDVSRPAPGDAVALNSRVNVQAEPSNPTPHSAPPRPVA
jgi:hypothetical protein